MGTTETRIRKLFKSVDTLPNMGISDTIWLAIEIRQAKARSRAILGYISLSIISASGFIFESKELATEFAQSGFSSYLSAAFSDGGMVVTYWKELLLSLADSLPVMSLTITLSLLFILFISIRKTAHQFRNPINNIIAA